LIQSPSAILKEVQTKTPLHNGTFIIKQYTSPSHKISTSKDATFFNAALNYNQLLILRKLSRKRTEQSNADRKICKSKYTEHETILCTVSHGTDISFPEN